MYKFHKNIYNTQIPQNVELKEGLIVITFKANDYIESNITEISGFLFNPSGWNDKQQKYLPVQAKLAIVTD